MFSSLGISAALFCCFWAVSQAFYQERSCKIFCEGPILDAVQMAHIFKDSKDFVDMPLRYDVDTTVDAFNALPSHNDTEVIRQFVEDYFLPPGTELEPCRPTDFFISPIEFDKIADPVYRQWAKEIHMKWKTLCRRVKIDVKLNPERYSLIYVPHPFIAPGGRFREFYYWDSYWIIKGLLASGMRETAKNMIRNLGHMVRRYGFVPNGGRIYYLKRSQPPLLPYCVQAYYEATQDLKFVKEMLPLLERELNFWEENRSIAFKADEDFTEFFQFFQYRVKATAPRPESYREDLETAEPFHNLTQKHQVWGDIAAACETGWDFSTRWFSNEGDFAKRIESIRTSKVIPVDLNAFICGNQKILAELHALTGNSSMAQSHNAAFEFMKHGMYMSFWDQNLGSWFDLNTEDNSRSSSFYVSNPTPLFTQCFHSHDAARRTIQYFQHSAADTFPGGLPTSFEFSGQQWDSPNGWAPTTHIVIEGLRQSAEVTGDQVVADAAFKIANQWIQTNYFVYVRSGGKMFEKYDVESEYSTAGTGGEYEVQEGFGWTNGVILDLLLTYGDRLRAPKAHSFFFARQLKSLQLARVSPAIVPPAEEDPVPLPDDDLSGHNNVLLDV